MKIKLTLEKVKELCRALTDEVLTWVAVSNETPGMAITMPLKTYGVPRGGVPVALILEAQSPATFVATEDWHSADIVVDDLIDSGTTKDRWETRGKPFFALIDKRISGSEFQNSWVVFPWENEVEEGIEDNVVRILQFIGEDPKRGGLLDTPRRVVKAWAHWAGGYNADIKSILKCFEDGADGCDEMIVVKDIPFYTHCEHHMAPFFGTATVAYVPNGRIVGLSKLSRVVDAFARRLQVQERLTNQIADALQEHLAPLGVGVVITARHLCMESRGIEKQGSQTITSALRGVMRTSSSARSEFLALATK